MHCSGCFGSSLVHVLLHINLTIICVLDPPHLHEDRALERRLFYKNKTRRVKRRVQTQAAIKVQVQAERLSQAREKSRSWARDKCSISYSFFKIL